MVVLLIKINSLNNAEIEDRTTRGGGDRVGWDQNTPAELTLKSRKLR